MKVNKIAAFTGIVMALSAGVAQAVKVDAPAVLITAQVGAVATGCTVIANPLSLGQVTPGTAINGVLAATANCTAATPYSYSFLSSNGGAGATGRLVSGACSLNYSIVSYTINGGVLGAVNYFITPPAAGASTGSGADQISRFGVVVAAAQPGCVLPANAPTAIAADNLIVSVNY